MANSKGAPQHVLWKPGQSGNPSGRAKLPPELQAIRVMSPYVFARIFSKYAAMSREDMARAVNDPAIAMIDLAVCAAITNAAKTGDFSRVAWMLERVIGKPLNSSIDDAESQMMKDEIAKLSDSELLERAKLAVIEMESK